MKAWKVFDLIDGKLVPPIIRSAFEIEDEPGSGWAPEKGWGPVAAFVHKKDAEWWRCDISDVSEVVRYVEGKKSRAKYQRIPTSDTPSKAWKNIQQEVVLLQSFTILPDPGD